MCRILAPLLAEFTDALEDAEGAAAAAVDTINYAVARDFREHLNRFSLFSPRLQPKVRRVEV
jgi:hypothetical protein